NCNRALSKRSNRQRLFEALHEAATIETHHAVFTGRLERVPRQRAYDACGPIRPSSNDTQLIRNPQLLEPRLARGAQLDRLSNSASDERRNTLRPNTFERLAYAIIWRAQLGNAASPSASKNDTVPAHEKDEIGRCLDQHIGGHGK